jgi:uncharacterized phage protein (TIGR02218 family)
MKSASAPLLALLASQFFLRADLITLTLKSGAVLRLTNAQTDIVWAGNTYAASLPFERGNTRITRGIEVDTHDCTLYPADTHTVAGVPLLQAAAAMALQGADYALEQAFWPAPGVAITGTLPLFAGRVADTQVHRTAIALTIKSDTEVFDIMMPRNLVSPTCQNTLYDANCRVSRAAFTVAATVTAGSTVRSVMCTIAHPPGWFDRGTLVFTSGSNAGQKRTIRQSSSGNLTLVSPLIAAPVAGDTLTVAPNCDRTQSACGTKFSNLGNFRAMPYVPAPEASL